MKYKMMNEKLMEKKTKKSMFERRGHTREQRTIFGVHQQHSKNRGSREKHA